MPHPKKLPPPRGLVAIGMILVMVFLLLVVTSVAVCDARDSDTSRNREQADRAFYAADAGIQMAIRELMENVDEDGDGGIGTISYETTPSNNPANNPTFNGARVDVGRDVNNGFVSLFANSSLADCLKKITLDIRTESP